MSVPTGAPGPGVLRSVAIACSPDTVTAGSLVDLAAAPELKGRDGGRWTTYAAPDLTLALAGPSEMPEGATVSLNVKVPDVRAALARLQADGAEPCGEVVEGDHEVRGSIWLAANVALTCYQPR